MSEDDVESFNQAKALLADASLQIEKTLKEHELGKKRVAKEIEELLLMIDAIPEK